MTSTKNTPEAQRDGQSETIEPLKLKTVNGFRGRVWSILKNRAAVYGLSAVLAGIGGNKSESAYQEWRHGRADTAEDVAEDSEADDEESPEGILKKSKKILKKSGEWAKKKIDDAVGETKLVRKYKKQKSQLKQVWEFIEKLPDKTVFWLPFLSIFLGTVWLANKILAVKKALSQKVDPAVEQNMRIIEAKINEIIARVNSGGTVNKQEVVGLMDDLAHSETIIAEAPAPEDDLDRQMNAAAAAADKKRPTKK